MIDKQEYLNPLATLLGNSSHQPNVGLNALARYASLGLPTKRKLFISYYHRQDQNFKDRFEQLFGTTFINKSVQNGDINTDVGDEYIKRLIQSSDYLRDASVLVVLCGENTWGRKHVDWEISGALNQKVGGYSGVLGILLPSHPGFNENKYEENSIPRRLLENIQSGYATIYRWTEDSIEMKRRIEEAFNKKKDYALIKNSSSQMQRNTATCQKSLVEKFYGETSGYE